jgi:hypothetical protein
MASIATNLHLLHAAASVLEESRGRVASFADRLGADS